MQIIMKRIEPHIGNTLRNEQAGFRANRSCIDQSNTLRLIVEQSNEFNSPLYLLFVDFEKAFDSINRNSIWQSLMQRQVPGKIVRIIKALYEEAACCVQHNNRLSEDFVLFITTLDDVLRETDCNIHGIQWTLTQKLGDLDFADDICLLSNSLSNMQEMLNKLVVAARKRGLKIDTRKTKLMRINTTNNNPIRIEDQNVEDVEAFGYLGSMIASTGGTKEDIESRLAKARMMYGQLRNVWNSPYISRQSR